jgi:hypothetical protein
MHRVPFVVSMLLLCALGACAPEGGPTAFVTFNMVPDSKCVWSPSSGDKFYPVGRFDISPGGNGMGDACAHPYEVHLLVNSFLRPNANVMVGRAEPNVLQIHSAQVRLMTIQKQTLLFNQGKTPLPNPFLVTTGNSLYPSAGTTPTTGIAAVQAIPKAYAQYLSMFVGAQILAEIQVFGTTTGNTDVTFKPFVYPIEICDGCNVKCASADLGLGTMMGTTRMDVVGDRCDDNSGNDDRICIDTSC